jgi:hypothetical protein
VLVDPAPRRCAFAIALYDVSNTLISMNDAATRYLVGTRHFVFMPVPSETFVERGSQNADK